MVRSCFQTCWCWVWAAECRFWSCSEPPCASSALCCHRWSSGWCRPDSGHLVLPCCLVLPKHNVHTHINPSTPRKRKKGAVKSGVKLSVRKKDKKERKEKEYWECQHTGQIQQKKLSFDLSNIALGSALGLHFQKPVTVTLASERSHRVFEIGKHFPEHFYTPSISKFIKKN